MTDEAIEQEIQAKGKTAPRITPDQVEANIASEHYFTAADGFRFQWLTEGPSSPERPINVRSIADSIPTRTYSGICIDIDANAQTPAPLSLLTFCVLVLKNGFTVTGESACASPENFDAEIGRQNAVAKLWPLMGYELRSCLANDWQIL